VDALLARAAPDVADAARRVGRHRAAGDRAHLASVAFGLNAKSVETAINKPLLLILLPFLSSSLVPDHHRRFVPLGPATCTTGEKRNKSGCNWCVTPLRRCYLSLRINGWR
jgi:hypothetical protein